MMRLHVFVRYGFAAASLVLGTVFLASPEPSAAQEGQPPGKPKPDAAATAPRAPGPRNVIEGTDEDERLNGGDADDWVFGRKGNDVIVGGRGRDVVDAGEGDDTVDGGADNDILDGGPGADTIRGGDGDDTIEGNDDDDFIDGGGGNDDADGGDGNDALRGGPGADVLAGGDGDDSLSGLAGNDQLSGNDGIDSILGGAGNDRIAGGDGDDTALGEAGDDIIDGGQGDDSLKGGAGNDILTGSWGADALDGGLEHDTLFGGDGRDVVTGGSGSDLLFGGSGADVVNGGDGDDIIVIRAGDVPSGEIELADGAGGADLLTLVGFTPRDLSSTGDLVDPITGGTYRVVSVERIQHTHSIPHVGLDPARSTSLLFVNPSATETASGRLVVQGSEGMPITPRADALKNGVFTIPPLGAAVVDLFAPEAATDASLQVFANVPLAVTAQTVSSALGPFSASETPLIDGAMVPMSDDAGGGTGMLIMNGPLRSRVKFTIYSPAGVELECCSSVVELAPYAQRTVWVRDLFPRLGIFQGTVSVETGADRPQEGGPIAIVALQRRGDSIAASVPVRIGPSSVAGPLMLSSVTTGGDAPSAIALVNPSFSARVHGTLAFFDQQGRPWPVVVNRQSAATTTTVDLGPRGSVVLTLAGGGPAQTGFARLETTEGTVGGLVRTAGAATVADSTPATAATAFVVPCLRDRATGVTTELTITSTGPAATIQFALHDQAGAQVPGGAAQIRVPTNGQTVRSFDELFPNVKAADLRGTIVATSDQRVWTTVTRSGGGRRVHLPVLPTR
jgi:hypothetical protein